jgi:hypothetical protein
LFLYVVEDEQGPNENNQSAAHADLSSLNRETTYNGKYFFNKIPSISILIFVVRRANQVTRHFSQ